MSVGKTSIVSEKIYWYPTSLKIFCPLLFSQLFFLKSFISCHVVPRRESKMPSVSPPNPSQIPIRSTEARGNVIFGMAALLFPFGREGRVWDEDAFFTLSQAFWVIHKPAMTIFSFSISPSYIPHPSSTYYPWLGWNLTSWSWSSRWWFKLAHRAAKVSGPPYIQNTVKPYTPVRPLRATTLNRVHLYQLAAQ